MSTPTYILAPGQGAQHVGMGKDWYASSPAAKSIFDRASHILGYDLAAIAFDGPEDRLNQTDISQPAIFVTSIASHAAAEVAGRLPDRDATVFAGLSLGEYTALHLAGVFNFETGLKLVAARGNYMQEAAVATPSSMVALIGADEAAVTRLCEEASHGEVLVPANFNAPGQIVVSGTKAACERMVAAAGSAGFRAVALAVAGAFHSPLMQSGADKMRAELDCATFAAPSRPVYSNVTAGLHGSDTAEIKRLLVEQIVKPVRWEQTMQAVVASGENRYIELAPGKVLTGLLKKINRRTPVENLATVEEKK